MSKGPIIRSIGADGLAHTFDTDRVSGGKKINRKIECMKDADICINCTKEKCTGSQKCINKRKKELNGGK